jgi:DNA-binding transcriptional LysR family regulator
MHLRQLQYLRLVIEKGSFALAAEAAGVSQPAITLAMQRLERQWGVTLFEKVGRQKVPTRTAVAAARRAQDVQDRVEALPSAGSRHAAWSPGRDAAVLRVGMAPAAALLYGPTIETVWRSHEPEGLLQIVRFGAAGELLESLRSDDLDLVIAPRPRRYQAGDVRRTVLHTSTPTVYVRAGHPLAGARSLADIAQAGWGVAGRAGTPGNVIEEALRVHRLPAPRVLVQCDDYPTLLNLVATSDLLCVVPHAELTRRGGQTGISPVKIREGLPLYEVCLFWRSGKPSRHAHALADITRALKALAR